MHDTKSSSRRRFLKSSAVTAAAVAGAPAIVARGANERIRVGFIGVGNRGSQLLHAFMQHRDVEVAAFADVYEPYLTRDRSKVCERWIEELGGRIPAMGENIGNKVDTYTDFRRLIDRKDIDAVCIATPDHWHAIQTIMAMESGKDVYVEKPLTIALREGRAMVDAAKRTNRVVQVGIHRRGSKVYRDIVPFIQNGGIGQISMARAYRISNMYPDGIGKMRPEDPPPGFDWDMWLGPREYRPYQYNITPYKFRWWKSYSTQMGNWGVHYMDGIRWFMDETAPLAITTHGGQYVLDDDRTIPDTMEVTFEMPSGAVVIFGVYEACGGPMIDGDLELRGTKGNFVINERGYTLTPSGPGQFQEWQSLTDEKSSRLETREDVTVSHVRNFLDCIKSREKPWCDIETGHRSTSFAHLANIALETGIRIEWDAEREVITNSKEANDLLGYEYRKPWTLG